MAAPVRIGIVGARGHVGVELLRLVAAHPALAPAFVVSREFARRPVDALVPGLPAALRFEDLSAPQVAARAADVVVLALPNGLAASHVEAIDAQAPGSLVVDLSADHRFDPRWYYGLPELTRGHYAGQRRLSNPGCYATAMQLAIAPMLGELRAPVQCFGVSGYSGAGTTPSDKNDPDKLRDNLMPYQLVGHLHEREVSRQLAHEVQFMPHVASHFRGITMTVNMSLSGAWSLAQVRARYQERYGGEAGIRLVDEAPWVSRIAGRHGVEIGGFTLAPDGRRLVVVATLDNLLKGAATQALQNINLALGLPEREGIPT